MDRFTYNFVMVALVGGIVGCSIPPSKPVISQSEPKPYTQADCKQDLTYLDQSAANFAVIFQAAATKGLNFRDAYILIESYAVPGASNERYFVPYLKMGECGAKAKKAFQDFKVEAIRGISYQNEEAYKKFTDQEKQIAKEIIVKRVKEKQEMLREATVELASRTF